MSCQPTITASKRCPEGQLLVHGLTSCLINRCNLPVYRAVLNLTGTNSKGVGVNMGNIASSQELPSS